MAAPHRAEPRDDGGQETADGGHRRAHQPGLPGGSVLHIQRRQLREAHPPNSPAGQRDGRQGSRPVHHRGRSLPQEARVADAHQPGAAGYPRHQEGVHPRGERDGPGPGHRDVHQEERVDARHRGRQPPGGYEPRGCRLHTHHVQPPHRGDPGAGHRGCAKHAAQGASRRDRVRRLVRQLPPPRHPRRGDDLSGTPHVHHQARHQPRGDWTAHAVLLRGNGGHSSGGGGVLGARRHERSLREHHARAVLPPGHRRVRPPPQRGHAQGGGGP